METITKISATEYQKSTPQVNLVVTKTLDNLLAEKISLDYTITKQQAKLAEVTAEIVKVKALGIKTFVEAYPPIIKEIINPVIK